MTVDLTTEKAIVYNLLRHLYNDTYANNLFESLYPIENQHSPFFSSSSINSTVERQQCQHQQQQQSLQFNQVGLISQNSLVTPTLQISTWKIKVENLVTSHYAKRPFPPFIIRITSTTTTTNTATTIGRSTSGSNSDDNNDNNTNKEQIPPSILVQISVWNRWADVSSDVLQNQNLIRKVKRGILEVRDLVIHEVSQKHGGYFLLHITPYKKETLPFIITAYESEKLILNSERTWAKRKKDQKPISETPINSENFNEENDSDFDFL